MNPIVKIIESMATGFFATMYASVFTRAKFDYRKIFLNTLVFGLLHLYFLNSIMIFLIML
jgi:hypothetical protein